MRKTRLLVCLSILLIILLVVSAVAVFLTTQQVDDPGETNQPNDKIELRLEWQQFLPGIEGWSIIQTSDGGYLVLGKNSSIITINSLQEYSEKNDAVLVKTDANGNILWHRIYPLLGSRSRRIEVIETNDGCYTFGGTLYNGSEPSQCYLVKVDSEGNVLWNRTYVGPNIQLDSDTVDNSVSLTDFLQLDDGSYIIIGVYKADFYHSGGYYIKVDSSGNLQLSTKLGLGSSGSIKSINDDSFVIMTGFAGRGGSGSYFGLAKIDFDGTMIWEKSYFEKNSMSSSGRSGVQTSGKPRLRTPNRAHCFRLAPFFHCGNNYCSKSLACRSGNDYTQVTVNGSQGAGRYLTRRDRSWPPSLRRRRSSTRYQLPSLPSGCW